MCRKVECNECKKPTFAGCGMHVEQVLGGVPEENRCSCREAPRKAATTETSVLGRFFGR